MRTTAVTTLLAAGASGLGVSFPPGPAGNRDAPAKSTYAFSSPFAYKEFMEANFPTQENIVQKNSSQTCVEWVKLCIDDGTATCGQWGAGEFQIHSVGAYKRDSGAKSMEAIETEFTKAFGAMKAYDPYFENHLAFLTTGLDTYVSTFKKAGVPYFASTFTDPATNKQYSSILIQVPGSLAAGAKSLLAIELLGETSDALAAQPGVHRYELPRASSEGLASAAARLAAAPRKYGANGQPVLTMVHLSFASSDLARDVQWFEKVLQGQKVYEGSAAEGQVYSGVLSSGNKREIRFVQSTSKTQGPTSVAQWEKYQTDLHNKCMPASNAGSQGFDRLADNHFDNPLGADLTSIMNAQKAAGMPYRYFTGNFAYLYGPNGWGVQLIGQGLPSGAGYDFCKQGITGHCNKDL